MRRQKRPAGKWGATHKPSIPAAQGSPPTRIELLDLMESLEIVLGDMMRSWQGGIPAESRVEIMVQVYEPLLRMLIRAGRHPMPRWMMRHGR